jgi:hypothetical protein
LRYALVEKIGQDGQLREFTQTTNFLRKYAAGWGSGNKSGSDTVPWEKEFHRIWSERKIECFKIK